MLSDGTKVLDNALDLKQLQDYNKHYGMLGSYVGLTYGQAPTPAPAPAPAPTPAPVATAPTPTTPSYTPPPQKDYTDNVVLKPTEDSTSASTTSTTSPNADTGSFSSLSPRRMTRFRGGRAEGGGRGGAIAANF